MSDTEEIKSHEVWKHYVSHFSFAQLGWLFAQFQDQCDANGLIQAKGELYAALEEWLKYRWPAIIPSPKDEFIEESLRSVPFPLDFHRFVSLLNLYQEAHIESEDHAGFDPDNVDALKDIYDDHNTMPSGPNEGLKGRALFAVLDDLGIQFHSKEERTWYVETVTRFDRDASGTINFQELCQIIRKVVSMEEEKSRRRQMDLIEKSGLAFSEVEDWCHLFLAKDVEGKGELELAAVKTLISEMGVKWDKQMSETILGWIQEADENNNGTIDFGEFCLVIAKMWQNNLKDIRGISRELSAKDKIVSLKCVHGTYLAAGKDGSVTASRTEAGDPETFVMKKQPNSNVCLLGRPGKYLKVTDWSIAATGDNNGTEFKVTTLEDERIQLTASTQLGGQLFVNTELLVAISDGNPADAAYTLFQVVSHEDLHKKCWSKAVRCPLKVDLVEARKNSVGTPRVDPLSPGMADLIQSMDDALEASSARGSGRAIR